MADETQAQVAEENQEQVSTPPTTPPEQASESGSTEGLDELKEALRKERKDGSKANREAQAAKKRLAELEAKFQEIEDAKKTDLEKALAKAEKAEKEKADILSRLEAQERKNAARDAGVQSPYAEYAATEFAKAQGTDPELKPEDFFKDFKATHPAMFGEVQAPGSGAGGPATGGSDKASKLAALNEEYQALLGRRGSDQVERRLLQISNEVQQIRQSMNSH